MTQSMSQPADRTTLQNGAGRFTMYSTPWCGYCHRLKGQLDREGISFDVVDIEQHPEAAALVASVNNGNRTVPTLVYSDGSAQTNPSLIQVKEKLVALAS
jgi:mycoredoxin